MKIRLLKLAVLILILLCTGCRTGDEGDDNGGDTPSDALISPTTATFDKNVANQANIAVSMTLNGNTLDAISDGSRDLAAGSDYSMSGSSVTIHKSYLAGQAAVPCSLPLISARAKILSWRSPWMPTRPLREFRGR
jgi:hypothetical protein